MTTPSDLRAYDTSGIIYGFHTARSSNSPSPRLESIHRFSAALLRLRTLLLKVNETKVLSFN
jgi:hypothetical protein